MSYLISGYITANSDSCDSIDVFSFGRSIFPCSCTLKANVTHLAHLWFTKLVTRCKTVTACLRISRDALVINWVPGLAEPVAWIDSFGWNVVGTWNGEDNDAATLSRKAWHAAIQRAWSHVCLLLTKVQMNGCVYDVVHSKHCWFFLKLTEKVAENVLSVIVPVVFLLSYLSLWPCG